MSRTDKTRPGRLVEFQDGVLRHDHRHGVCRIETLADVRHRRAPRPTCRYVSDRGLIYQRKIHGDRVGRGLEHLVFHNPMRRSARDVLHRAAGEYNAGHRPADNDIEDRWEPPTLSPSGAEYLFW
jgi:hypothetical protein